MNSFFGFLFSIMWLVPITLLGQTTLSQVSEITDNSSDTLQLAVSNKKSFKIVYHEVEFGETLYAISRKFNTSYQQILRFNPGIDANVIMVGQKVAIPMDESIESAVAVTKEEVEAMPSDKETAANTVTSETKDESATIEKPQPEETIVTSNGTKVVFRKTSDETYTDPLGAKTQVDYKGLEPIYHKVMEGETLFRISQQYNHDVELLKDWNNLESEVLSIQQRLIIGWYSPNPTEAAELAGTARNQYDIFSKKYYIRSQQTTKFERASGKGMGTWIKDSSTFDSNLYVLHKDAPQLSILKLINPMNRKYVYVKVVGHLPDNGDNVSVKVTSAIAKRLNLLDDKFQLKWSYYKLKE